MIQPGALTDREAAGDKKISTYFNCDVLKFCCSCWCHEVDDGVLWLMKLEVVVEVYVEMQKIVVVVVESWCGERVLLKGVL
jgi:hypothetical protein